MKRPALHTSFAGTVLATSLALAALTAQAETYTLTNEGTSAEPAAWGTATNWSPEGVPGSGDSFKWAINNVWDARSAYLALDTDYAIGSMLGYYRYLYLSNSSGADDTSVTLTFHANLGEGQPQWYVLGQGVKLVALSTATITGSTWEQLGSKFDLGDGSSAEIFGSIYSRRITWNIGNATLLFQPSSYSQTSNCNGDIFNVTGGEVSFPVGLNVTGGDASNANRINQSNGVVKFGGNFTSAMPWTYTWSGGTLAITNDSTFGANVALVIPASATVTLDVASGKTFSAPGLTADSTATITKTGEGVFAMTPTEATIAVDGGSIAINATTYDLSKVSFAANTAIKLAQLGGRVDVPSATLANATFVADLTGATAGTIVFQSIDSDVLAKVQSDLAGLVPSGLSLAVNDGVLYIAAQVAYDKTYNSSGEISDMPGSGAKIAIDGSGTVVTLSSPASVDAFKSLGSIEVKNGATLSIRTDVNGLPPIILNMKAALEITNDATVVLANAANLSCIAMQTQVPVLTIASGSTLSVPGGMKFKNVDFRLYGVVTKPNNMDLSPVFGYAGNGETSYFALTVDGGTFDLHSTDNSGQSNEDHAACGSVSIVCPESGGTVVPIGQIVLRNASRTVESWSDFGNWDFGLNNPTNVPFNVLIDGTHLDCGASFHASGAAHLELVNGAYIRRDGNCLGHSFDMAIQYDATIDVGSGCYINFATDAGVFGIDSQSPVDTVKVSDGGIYSVTANSSGWARGIFVADGGVLGVHRVYDHRERTNLLRGFASARIDGDLLIKSLDLQSSSNHYVDSVRNSVMANIPFSGVGNVVITNGVPADSFTVTMQNGANTATGTIKVAKAEGDAETKLYFANGANWAGTVVADGNVALTNLTDAADAVAVKFGTLQLDADFAIRVKKTGGQIVANDKVTADNFAGIGRLTFVAMDEPLERGDVIELGKVKSGANLPKVARNYKLILGEADEYDYCPVYAKYSLGMQIIFR